MTSVLQEIERTGGPAFEIDILPHDDDMVLVMATEPGGIGTGFTVNPDYDTEILRDLADDYLFEAAVESTHGAWP